MQIKSRLRTGYRSILEFIRHYISARSFSTVTSFVHVTNNAVAIDNSSVEGKVGAIRMLESSGSLPYGYAAPAPVSTRPASLHLATIAFAHPFWALKEMKYPPTGLLQDAIPHQVLFLMSLILPQTLDE